jgi:hypothetical protein
VAPAWTAWQPAVAADPTPAEIEAAEGRLVIYTSSVDADMQKLVAAFEKRCPEIHAEWIRQPSTTVFNRFVGEAEASVVRAELLHTASTALPGAARALPPAHAGHAAERRHRPGRGPGGLDHR